MLKLIDDKSHQCNFCSKHTFDLKKYKLTTTNGGYFIVCSECIKKLENKIKEITNNS